MAPKHNGKKILRMATLVSLFVFIFCYGIWNSRGVIFGVDIENVTIQNKSDSQSIVNITGNAKNALNLTLNGREISIDQAGNFDETISLHLGYNIITIKAKDKFGLEDEEVYQLMR